MTCITNVPRSHRVGISAPGQFEPGSPLTIIRALAVVSNSHTWTPEYAEDDSQRGNPWLSSEGVVYNRGQGSGPLTLRPRADDFRFILPLLLGGAFSGNEIEPAIICNFFRLQADKSVAVFDHRDAKTNSWTLSSSSGQPVLQLEWNIESCKYVRTNAGTFTSGLDLSIQQPFVHTASTVTIDGDVYKVDDVSISGNNNLLTDIFFNSQTRTDLAMGNQVFQFTHTSPFNVSADLALLDLGASSVSGQVVYTAAGGSLTLTIDFPALHAPVAVPITPAGNTPVRYEGIQWTARTVGTGAGLEKPIKFTLDDDATTTTTTSTTTTGP
jgi:hypothetical protein